MTRSTVMITTALAVAAMSGSADAQQWIWSGNAGLGTGVEGGDPGTGQAAFRRARTRIIAGLDARLDEDMNQAWGAQVFAEVEPHMSVGADARYMRWLSRSLLGFVGATGSIAPHTLFGGSVGVQVHLPLDSPSATLYVEPSFAALPLGTDLPGDRVLLWGLLAAGIRTRL